jgi:thimet oligopeptidase
MRLSSTHRPRRAAPPQGSAAVGWLAATLLLGLASGPIAHASESVDAPHDAAAFVFAVPRSAAAVAAECVAMLADLRRSQARLAQGAEPPTAALLAELDAMTRREEDTLGPLGVLAAVSPRKAIRDAAEACEREHETFSARLWQDAAVHARLQQVRAADDIDRRQLREALDDFADAGVALPGDRQQRVRELREELTRLTQRFERRLREDRTQLTFTAAELAGVPRDVWRRAPRDAQGRYRLGLAQATVFPLLEHATRSATRERMWRAFLSQGGGDNLQTLAALAQARRELAQQFGFESHADFVLRRRMAHSQTQAQTFLATVKDAVRQRERSDLAELRAEKAQHLHQSIDDTLIQRWDVAFYSERLRRARYAVDQEQFRAYFPPEASLRLVFALAERLLGVSVEPLAQREPLWHRDARGYVLSDTRTKALLGTLFVDLYPRAAKFNHAAVWSFRNASTLAGRRPAAAMVVNFNRQGLTLEELETLLHEFGHALHSLLSNTRYAAQGGTNVQLDFVEAPSQMLEDWVYDPQVLALMAPWCASCPTVPPALLAQARAARDFGKGIGFSRQHLYARYDLALYGRESADPLALWTQMETDTPLGSVSGTLFPAGFEHIASGYAAGYYGYLWSLVIAEDLRTAFAADRLDAQVGRRYRETVLEQGGQAAPDELLRRFLGRATDSRAFFESLGK